MWSWVGILRFAARLLRRDLRSGGLKLLLFSLILAVAALSSVGFFTGRVERAMRAQAADMLAADMRVVGRKSVPAEFEVQAQSYGLQTARTVNFRSVVMAENEQTVLAEIKAVSAGYPLRGTLKIATGMYTAGVPVQSVPAPGQVWVESRLLSALGLQPGDALVVGDQRFVITYVLTQEPDRGGSLWQLGPRVLMNMQDIDSTRLLGPMSVASFRLLLRGESGGLASFKVWVKDHLHGGFKLEAMESARPEIRSALDRARQFLGLAVMVAVILCAVGIAMAAHHFSEQQLAVVAIMKTMGATQSVISRIFMLYFVLLALFASVLGCALGFVVQHGLALLLEGWFFQRLPLPDWMPVLIGMLAGMLLLIGFVFPPLLRLKMVSPLRVLRHELDPPRLSVWLVWGAGLCVLLVLLYGVTQNLQMVGIFASGIALTIVVSSLLAKGLLWLTGRLPRWGSAWRYGFANLQRRNRATVLQLTAFSISVMVLLLLTIVRNDLQRVWEAQIPLDTPNHFLVNIQPDERAALGDLFSQAGMTVPVWGPVIVARLLEINGRAVSATDYVEARAQRMVERDQRLSFVSVLAKSNQIVSGAFWSPATAQVPQWSLEESFAESLGVRQGDELAFMIAGSRVAARVGSIRKVDWGSMEVNFFILGTPGLLASLPATYLASFYLEAGNRHVVPDLIRKFPGVSVLDVGAILQQLSAIMDRAIVAIEYIFGFTLIACLLMLYITIYSSRDTRRQEAALLRALGASRKQVLTGFATEFVTLGVLAGVAGAVFAYGVAYALAKYIFELEYGFNLDVLLMGALGGGVSIGLAGIWGTYRLTSESPLQVLNG